MSKDIFFVTCKRGPSGVNTQDLISFEGEIDLDSVSEEDRQSFNEHRMSQGQQPMLPWAITRDASFESSD